MPQPPTTETSGPLNLLAPFLLLGLSMSYIPITIVQLIKTFQFHKLTSWSSFQHAWFGTFWTYFGAKSKERGADVVGPLLQTATGVVLDIGPGSGEWLDLFAPAKNQAIVKIYGVEPNPEHHPALRKRITDAGLDGVYEILGVGAEDLASCGIEPASVDTICTIQCLCSVPGPDRIVKDLYPYLKSGGKWLVYEHIKTKHQADFVGYWQRLIDHIWPFFFGGCSITRPTDEYLLQAGEWETVSLKPLQGEGKYDVVPHAMGTLVKR